MKLGLAVVALGMSVATCARGDATPVASTELTAAQLRRDRAETAEHLEEAGQLLHALASTDDVDLQRALMHKLVVIFSIYIADQARWEEATLAAPLRGEHGVMLKWLDDLVTIVDREDLDRDAFVLRAYQLLGYARMHLEREDRLFFPPEH